MKYYKVLIDGKSIHGGNLEWDLPKGKKPGKWHSVNGKILKCQSGLHLTTKPYKWFKWGADVFEAEGKGIHDGDEDKIAFKSARLIKKLDKQSWLIDAEIFVDSIKNIKWFSNGKLPRSEKIKMFKTRAAAGDATRAATRDVAWAAARAAAAARDAARDAAGAAAWAAAWAAAGDAGWAAQCEWLRSHTAPCFTVEEVTA